MGIGKKTVMRGGKGDDFLNVGLGRGQTSVPMPSSTRKYQIC